MDIDFDNKAYFVIFTVLGYPPGMDEQLNELPDAIRPLPEVYFYFNIFVQISTELLFNLLSFFTMGEYSEGWVQYYSWKCFEL